VSDGGNRKPISAKTEILEMKKSTERRAPRQKIFSRLRARTFSDEIKLINNKTKRFKKNNHLLT